VAYGEFLSPEHIDEASSKKLEAIAKKHGQQVYPQNFFG